MSVVLALDLGTTSTAALAVDHHGKLIHVVRRDHDADVSGLPAGHAEQDPHTHLRTSIEVLKELSAKLSDRPTCLGLTGQMHSVLAVDAARRPLTNLITWQDRRANHVDAGFGTTFLNDLLSRCDEQSLSDAGCRLAPGYGAVSLFVLRERDQPPPDVSGIAPLADWVAAELTDGPIRTDRSHAASWGIYDLRHDRWSESLREACSIPAEWLPGVVAGGEPLGGLCPQFAAATGLPAGLPICAAIGDNQASVLGSVPDGETSIQITVGTGGQINWPIDAFDRVEGMDTRPLPIDRMMLVGAGLAGGDAYAWVQRLADRWLRSFGEPRDSDELYDVLNRLAAETPGDADGLVCEPFFRGTRRDPLRRGTVTGIGVDNFTPGHIARAVLNGIAAGFHSFWSLAADNTPPNVQRIIGCGNGLEKNSLLARIIADQFSLPMSVPKHQEAAAYGAALLAGVMTGFWSSMVEAGRGIELKAVDTTKSAGTTDRI